MKKKCEQVERTCSDMPRLVRIELTWEEASFLRSFDLPKRRNES